jgi:pimeloyl-ACP methyl ester carboxylesterase
MVSTPVTDSTIRFGNNGLRALSACVGCRVPIVDVDGSSLAYDEHGSGPAVVFLHAGIADRRMRRHQVAALRGLLRLVIVDLPRYGESAWPTGAYANHDAVAGLFDKLGIGQAALVGCYLAGKVAIDMALVHPDRVRALALFGAVVSGHAWSQEFRRLQQSRFGDIADDDLDAPQRSRRGHAHRRRTSDADTRNSPSTPRSLCGSPLRLPNWPKRSNRGPARVQHVRRSHKATGPIARHDAPPTVRSRVFLGYRHQPSARSRRDGLAERATLRLADVATGPPPPR